MSKSPYFAAVDRARSVSTERRLIASVLLDEAACIADGLDEVGDELFTDRLCRDVWRAIAEARRRGEPVGFRRICEQLVGSDVDVLEVVRLEEEVPSAASFSGYLALLKQFAGTRALLDAAHRVLAAGAEGRPHEELRALVAAGLKAGDEAATTTRPRAIGDVIPEVIATHSAPAPDVVRTEIAPLDAALAGGMRPGELVVVAARPGVGKTTLALALALVAAKRGEPVLFVSLEMRAQELALKALARAAGMDPVKELQRAASERAVSVPDSMARAVEQLVRLPVHFDDAPKSSLQAAKAAIIRGARAIAARLVVVDYLGLLPADDRRASPYERTSAASRELKCLARTLGVPLLALAQLNREMERDGSREPRLSDLRDSGTIEQDADVVLLLARKGHRPDGQLVDAILAKNRNGPCGRVPLLFRPECSDFVDADAAFSFSERAP